MRVSGFLLVLLFTIIEFVGLFYWLVYGNSITGLIILFVALILEHTTAALQAEFFPVVTKVSTTDA